MDAKPVETREPLGDDITDDEIEKLKDERMSDGATSCDVVTENDKRILVCQWPPP